MSERKVIGNMVDTGVLFVDDISMLFRISKNTIRRKRWRKKIGIPIHKVGKRLCGSKEEIEKWFKGLNG